MSTLGNSLKYWQIYTGDNFQLERENCEKAFYTALKTKSTFKKISNIDVRIGIRIENKEFNTSRITETSGEVFVTFGYAFDTDVRKQSLAIKTSWSTIDKKLNIAFYLALLTMDSWTVNAAKVSKISLESENSTQK